MLRQVLNLGALLSAVGNEASEAQDAPILLQVPVGVLVLLADVALAHGAPAIVTASTATIHLYHAGA